MRLFWKAEGDFGRVTAVRDCHLMHPDEWWITYGNNAPNLQKLAVCILSQTCSASGCERNWSVFEFIFSKNINRMEHQRLNDLVYVRYNLRLHQRTMLRDQNYDPINFDDFIDNDKWFLEDDPPLLMSDELETFRNQMARLQLETNDDNDDEVINLENIKFGDDVLVHSTNTNRVNNDIQHGQTFVNEDGNGTSQENITVHHWSFE